MEVTYCHIIYLVLPVSRGKMSHPGLQFRQARRSARKADLCVPEPGGQHHACVSQAGNLVPN